MNSHTSGAIVVAALLALGVALAPMAARAAPAEKGPAPSAKKVTKQKYKLVIQVSDADPVRWNLALNNAENVQQALGKGNVTVEIVAYGPGIGMLESESKVADRLAQALDNSVVLDACEVTMHKQKLDKSDMYGGISYVPAGVVHIMQREQQGWQYIRP